MDTTLTVTSGRPEGSRAANRLRAEKIVPGVVYGMGSDPVSVSVEMAELRRALTTSAGLNALITLTLDNKESLCVVKQLQRHPVRRDVIHVDFLLIDKDAPLSVDVPVELIGEPEKVNAMKGMVEQLSYTLSIKAKPGSIPTKISADISGLDIGTQFKVGDLTLPEGSSTDVDPELPIAQGSATRSTILLQQQMANESKGAAAESPAESEEA